MQIVVKPFRTLIFALTLAALGCHAQTSTQTPTQAADGTGKLSPELVRRVEVLIRSHASIPAG